MTPKRLLGAFTLLVRLLLMTGAVPSALPGQDFDRGFEMTAPLIVMINADYGDTPEFGAGIVFGRDGNHVLIATAYHVVHRGPTQPSRILVRFRSMRDTPVEAKVIHHAAPGEMDLAVLSVDTATTHGFDVCKLSFARLGNAGSVQRHTLVSPVGNPNGTPWGVPVQPDEVSSVEGNEFVFQSSVISSGHSGGGLLDGKGNLLGMTIADQPPFGRAINIDEVIKTLKQWGYPVRLFPVLEDNMTPLHFAASKGDLATVTTLLDCGGVNALNDNKGTPLHEAAAFSTNTEVMSLLLKAGANIEAQDADGDTPLSWAAENGNVDAARFLLQSGAKPESRNHGNETVLYVAAKNHRYEVVKLLVAAHADVNALNSSGASPLEGVNYNGPAMMETAKVLLASGGKVRARSLADLVEKADGPDDLSRLATLLPGVANLEDEVSVWGTLLGVAAAAENPDTAKMLIAAGAKNNSVRRVRGGYETPLFLALKNVENKPQAVPVVALLVAHGGVVKVPGTTDEQLENLLRNAVDTNWKAAVQILLAAGTNPNTREDSESGSVTLLSIAKEKGNPEIVKLLVDAGAK